MIDRPDIAPRLGTVREEAAAWFARLSGGFATPSDRAAFETWLQRDALHREAYGEFDDVWARTEALRSVMPRVSIPAAAKSGATSLRRRAALGLALAATIGAVAFLPTLRDLVWFDRYTTAAGEQRSVTLADGSTVHLDGATTIDVRLHGDIRRVELVAGEALFAVAKDPARPFVVALGTRDVRVVGTVFDIRRAGERIAVAVAEGKVQVETRAQDAIALQPGDGIAFDEAADAGQRGRVPVDRIGSWRQNVLYYERATVADVVADLNRRFVPAITVADPRLAAQRVYTTLVVQDRAAMIRTLETLLSAKATMRADGVAVLTKK